MDAVQTEKQNKIHPHKFTLWVAMASIIMMFAGLTSAYIVKSGQPSWLQVQTPMLFWFSTAALLVSSLTMQLALRAIRQKEMRQYRQWLLVTTLLGLLFVVLQWMAFRWLWQRGVHFEGAGAGQFLYIIFGLHALHVLGGIIALIISTVRQFMGRYRSYSTMSANVLATYWHFVDALWIYLLVFFILIR